MSVELFCSGALVLVVLAGLYLRAVAPVPAVLVLFLHAGALLGGYEPPRSEIAFHPGQVDHRVVSMTPGRAVVDVENHSRRALRRFLLDCAYVRDGALARQETRPRAEAVPAGATVRVELEFDPALPSLDVAKDLSCLPRFHPVERAD